MMKTIAEEVEAFGYDYTAHYGTYSARHLGRRLLSICRAGAEIGREPDSPHKAMFAFTLNGNTALALSLLALMALGVYQRALRRLCLLERRREHRIARSALRSILLRAAVGDDLLGELGHAALAQPLLPFRLLGSEGDGLGGVPGRRRRALAHQ